MHPRSLSIALAVCALAACRSEPAEAPAEQRAAQPASADTEVAGPERRILAFGDSLFAGYGLAEQQGYPEKLETALRDAGIDARVVDAGVSGDTTASGRQRLAFTLDAQEATPDLVLLELGGNDMLRGLPPEQTRANLEAMLAELQRRGIPVLLMGMRAPPNYGTEYQRAFDAIYPELAEEYGATLVPFWLEAIYRDPAMFQDDRVHPTAAGIDRLVAATADEVAAALPVGEIESKE